MVPRPETEGLVEWVLEVLADRPDPVMADLGTGSGAIACAVASTLARAEVLAVELASGALAVASRNVRELGLSERVRLLAGDLFAPLGSLSASLDLVVANPPYLPSAVIGSLPPEVSRHEPRAALDGGPDGLGVIRRIVAGAPPVLKAGGWLLMEIGEEQAGPIAGQPVASGVLAQGREQRLALAAAGPIERVEGRRLAAGNQHANLIRHRRGRAGLQRVHVGDAEAVAAGGGKTHGGQYPKSSNL